MERTLKLQCWMRWVSANALQVHLTKAMPADTLSMAPSSNIIDVNRTPQRSDRATFVG